MTAIVATTECYRGEAKVIRAVMDPVVDITDWSILFTLRPNIGSTVTLFSASADVIDGPNGVFDIPLTASQTSQIAQAYAYDLWRTNGGQETMLSIGTFRILQRVK